MKLLPTVSPLSVWTHQRLHLELPHAFSSPWKNMKLCLLSWWPFPFQRSSQQLLPSKGNRLELWESWASSAIASCGSHIGSASLTSFPCSEPTSIVSFQSPSPSPSPSSSFCRSFTPHSWHAVLCARSLLLFTQAHICGCGCFTHAMASLTLCPCSASMLISDQDGNWLCACSIGVLLCMTDMTRQLEGKETKEVFSMWVDKVERLTWYFHGSWVSTTSWLMWNRGKDTTWIFIKSFDLVVCALLDHSETYGY